MKSPNEELTDIQKKMLVYIINTLKTFPDPAIIIVPKSLEKMKLIDGVEVTSSSFLKENHIVILSKEFIGNEKFHVLDVFQGDNDGKS